MKSILFVYFSLSNGGAEKSLVNLLNELPPNLYEIDLLLFKKEGLFLGQVPKYVRIIEPEKGLAQLYGPLKKSGRRSIVKVIGSAVTRILSHNIEVSTAQRWDYFYKYALPHMDKKYDTAVAYISGEIMYYVNDKVYADRKIVWIHNDYKLARYPEKYDRRHFKEMDAIVTISDECLQIFNSIFPEFKYKSYAIPNITSSNVVRKRADEFIPEECNTNVPVILSIGRLMPQKGFDLAIEAAAIMKKKGQRFKWLVLGSGRDKELLKGMIHKNGVDKEFALIGVRENPYPYIKNCTILAQTSRYEGKSVVLDEAKILCKPILATNYPTVYDQIQDGVDGVIAEMSPEGIANRMISFINDHELLENITKYLSLHEYGNSELVSEYIKIFEGE